MEDDVFVDQRESIGPVAPCACPQERGLIIALYNYTEHLISESEIGETIDLLETEITTLRRRAAESEEGLPGVSGKLRIGVEGINGTFAGPTEDCEALLKLIDQQMARFKDDSADEDINRWSRLYSKSVVDSGCAHVFPWDHLRVKHVPELVPLGIEATKVRPGKGCHVSPDEFREYVLQAARTSRNPGQKNVRESEGKATADDVVLLDCRNWYEWKLGHFEGSILPPTRKFSQLPEWLQRNEHKFKDKTVAMYCTGGVRCERAAALLEPLATRVVQLDGGIHRYLREEAENINRSRRGSQSELEVETRPMQPSLYKGKIYVFDARQSIRPCNTAVPAADDAIVGECDTCAESWEVLRRCSNPICGEFVLRCPRCWKELSYCCLVCAEAGPQSLEAAMKAQTTDLTTKTDDRGAQLELGKSLLKRARKSRGVCICERQRAAALLETLA
eukprot:Clim_evm34s241 gene=Clim_evmTU34s241